MNSICSTEAHAEIRIDRRSNGWGLCDSPKGELRLSLEPNAQVLYTTRFVEGIHFIRDDPGLRDQ